MSCPEHVCISHVVKPTKVRTLQRRWCVQACLQFLRLYQSCTLCCTGCALSAVFTVHLPAVVTAKGTTVVVIEIREPNTHMPIFNCAMAQASLAVDWLPL